jgi:hypothetical protein
VPCCWTLRLIAERVLASHRSRDMLRPDA